MKPKDSRAASRSNLTLSQTLWSVCSHGTVTRLRFGLLTVNWGSSIQTAMTLLCWISRHFSSWHNLTDKRKSTCYLVHNSLAICTSPQSFYAWKLQCSGQVFYFRVQDGIPIQKSMSCVLSPRNSIETYRRFGEKKCLHLQGTEISKATNALFYFVLLGLLFHVGFPPKRRWDSTGLHVTTSQIIVL